MAISSFILIRLMESTPFKCVIVHWINSPPKIFKYRSSTHPFRLTLTNSAEVTILYLLD